MITNESLKEMVSSAIDVEEVLVNLDGNHASILVVSDEFKGLSRVKQQQLVYAPLKSIIASGDLHAVSFRTYTAEEWQREKKLVNLSK